MQAATSKIAIIATTMEVTTAFQTVMSRAGKELSYGSDSRICDVAELMLAWIAVGLAGGPVKQLWGQVCQTKITMSLLKCRFLPLDFITTLGWTLTPRRFASLPHCTLTGSPPDSPASSLANCASSVTTSQQAPESAKRGARHSALRRLTRSHEAVKRSRLRLRHHAC